ncbi:MAG TPA: hypothetical protein VLI69_08260 [Gammaproteobacteria bacterium]|nr:hypothetical protein [Gammaproteobacteria bacterium]
MSDFQFEELTWDAVVSEIKSVDKKFAEIITALKPKKNFSFIKIRFQTAISSVLVGTEHSEEMKRDRMPGFLSAAQYSESN